MKTKDEILDLMRQGESLKLEAKSAKGGFPDSVWETYSAFANTDGGVILLGVGESKKDGSLFVEGLKDPRKILKDFWNMANNRQKISVNIISERQAQLLEIDGATILVIEVPRAERLLRPIYKGLDPRTGTYRRNGDGDFLCSVDEMRAMLRDATNASVDTEVINEMGLDVFCKDTIKSYRQIFRDTYPSHLWNHCDDGQFLRYLGAATVGKDGEFHPTVAGLLMFGWEYEITRKFPDYFLDYQEKRHFINSRWVDRITSQTGDWSGNLFDFAMKVTNRLQSDLKVPFVMHGNFRVDDTPVHKMLREAVTNTLTNADYYGRRGVVIVKDDQGFTFSNPGDMRVSPEDAIQGFISDPRGSTLLKIFSFIKFGERAGNGIYTIFRLWPKIYKQMPSLTESSDSVSRTTLVLPIGQSGPDVKEMLRLYDYEGFEETLVNEPYERIYGQKTYPRPEPEPEPIMDEKATVSAGPEPAMMRKAIKGLGPELARKIHILVEENPKYSIEQIAKLCGLSKSTISRQIKAMPELEHAGSLKGGYWRVVSQD